MSSNQQALLMDDADGGVTPPPVAVCVADQYYSCGPDGDPYWGNVVLALHFDSSFADSSLSACSVTANGSAVISTVAPKFGAGAAEFDGNGDYLAISDADLALGFGSFTIEFWIKPDSIPANQRGVLGNALLTPDWFFGLPPSGRLFFTQDSGLVTLADAALSVGVWQHIALVRNGTTIRLYVNGVVQVSTGPHTDNGNYTVSTIYAGAYNLTASDMFDGQIDDLRITKGIARYTGNFTIPTEAFPDFEGDTGYFSDPRTVLSLHADLDEADKWEQSPSASTVPRIEVQYIGLGNGSSPVSYISAANNTYISNVTLTVPSATSAGNEVFLYASTNVFAETLPTSTSYDITGGPTIALTGSFPDKRTAVAYQTRTVGQTAAGVAFTTNSTASQDIVQVTGRFSATSITFARDVNFYPNGGNNVVYVPRRDIAENQAIIAVVMHRGATITPPSGFTLLYTAKNQGVVTNGITPVPIDQWLSLFIAEGPRTGIPESSCFQEKTLRAGAYVTYDPDIKKFGTGSLRVQNLGVSDLAGLVVTDHQDFDFGTSDFTIECWAYRTANTYVGYLYYATMGGEFSLRVTTGGLITIQYQSSGGAQTRTTSTPFPLSQWNFVTVQRRGLNFECYLNGVLIDTVAITGGATSTVNSSGDWFWGRTNVASATSWNGYIDETRVTRGVARYTANFDPATLPNCDSTSSGTSTPVSGTGYIYNATFAAAQGSVTVANPWVALTGQAVTAAAGTATATLPNKTAALTGTGLSVVSAGITALFPDRVQALSGQNIAVSQGTLTRAIYPDLLNSGGTPTFGVGSGTTGFLCISFLTDGTYTKRWFADGVEFRSDAAVEWIDTTNTNFSIPAISHQYDMRTPNLFLGVPFVASREPPETLVGFPTVLALPAALSSGIHFYLFVQIPSPSSRRSDIQFAVVPGTTNPRYGEGSYYSTVRGEFGISIF